MSSIFLINALSARKSNTNKSDTSQMCMNNRHDENWEKEKQKRMTVNSKVSLPSDEVLEAVLADCWNKIWTKLSIHPSIHPSWLVYLWVNFVKQVISLAAILDSRKQLVKVCAIQWPEVWVRDDTSFCNKNNTAPLRSWSKQCFLWVQKCTTYLFCFTISASTLVTVHLRLLLLLLVISLDNVILEQFHPSG